MNQFLPVLVDNALIDNEQDLLPRVLGRPSLREVLEFCRNFRIAGIGALFLSAEADRFRIRLHKSGRAYAHFLAQAPEEAKLGSEALPFFDAIVSGDSEGAGLIARTQRQTWQVGSNEGEPCPLRDRRASHSGSCCSPPRPSSPHAAAGAGALGAARTSSVAR